MTHKNKYHIPNATQKRLYRNVIRAIERAQRGGLVFFGKQWYLTAYTVEANEYIRNSPSYASDGQGNGDIPNLAEKVLEDSGADDTFFYDEPEDNPCIKRGTTPSADPNGN